MRRSRKPAITDTAKKVKVSPSFCIAALNNEQDTASPLSTALSQPPFTQQTEHLKLTTRHFSISLTAVYITITI